MPFPFRDDDASEAESERFRRGRTIGLVCVSFLVLVGLWYLLPHRHEAAEEPEPVATPADALPTAQDDRGKPTSSPAPSNQPTPAPAYAAPRPSDTLPTEYVDETYGGTYHRANGTWEVVDNASRRVVRVDKEVSRNADFVELATENPDYPRLRLFPGEIEKNPTDFRGRGWVFVANGHWVDDPNKNKPIVPTGNVVIQHVGAGASAYMIQPTSDGGFDRWWVDAYGSTYNKEHVNKYGRAQKAADWRGH
jgi:hypothetical protein